VLIPCFRFTQRLRLLSLSKQERNQYDADVDDRRSVYGIMKTYKDEGHREGHREGHKEGIEIGEKRGRKQALIEVARAQLQSGREVKWISSILKVSEGDTDFWNAVCNE
jgi:predicted transposase YdaD